jgi:hypothetical protein
MAGHLALDPTGDCAGPTFRQLQRPRSGHAHSSIVKSALGAALMFGLRGAVYRRTWYRPHRASDIVAIKNRPVLPGGFVL